MKKLLLLILMIFTMGCAITQQSVCDTIPKGESIICKMAKEMKTTPETISRSLLVANVGALMADLYTAQQADEFITVLIEDISNLETEISYLSEYSELFEYLALPDKRASQR